MLTVNMNDKKAYEKMNDCSKQMFDGAKHIIEDLEKFYNDDFTEEERETEEDSLFNYFNDVLDVKYIISGDKKTLYGVELCVAWGGPAIYIDTYNNVIKCRWWGDAFNMYLPSELAEMITDFWENIYCC